MIELLTKMILDFGQLIILPSFGLTNPLNVGYSNCDFCVYFPRTLATGKKTNSELDKNHIKSQTMTDFFYYIFKLCFSISNFPTDFLSQTTYSTFVNNVTLLHIV